MISMYATVCEVFVHCTSKPYRKNFQIGSVEKLDCISLLHATYFIVLYRTILYYDISEYYTLLSRSTLYFIVL